MKTKLSFYTMSALALGSLLTQGLALANDEIPTKLKWSWSTSTFHPESNQVIAAPLLCN